ncbi:Cullin family [Popillia japonica]|uniref:Cullin-2 n=1 Tax=Popillia japonica TaxID=7064 RepID=A0AAW1MHY7_POPJA
MSLKPRIVDFDATWRDIQGTIRGVITLDNIPRKIWNDRFSDIYSLCVAHPESLADRLYAETKQFLIDHVARLLNKVQDDGEVHLVRNYYFYWSQYSKGAGFLHSLYLYPNQQHIKVQRMSDAEMIYGEQMEIGELALEVWRAGMIAPLGSRLVKLLLEAIDQDRVQHTTNIPIEAVKGTILSFVDVQGYKKKGQLQLYQELFEQPFLNASGEHYKRDAAGLLEERNVSLYMEKVIAKIDEELLRARKFLHQSSLQKVTQRCETHMVAEHLSFLYSECMNMVQGERKKDLSNMYNLLKSVPNALSVLVDTVLDHIKTQGLSAIGNLQGENIHISFVENLLTVYKKYRQQIQEVFNGDQNFMGALDKACSSVINHRPNMGKSPCRSPELLAKYCDTLLKKSSKGISETEVEEKLSQSITIFKYIDDKDVFQKFYSRMLAKRLIHQLTQSMDAEEAMINRLKQACGYEFTSKLHRMFTDMSVSSDLNNKFNIFLKKDNVELGINFGIYVLQAGAWPLGQAVVTPFALPQQLEKSVQKFEAFYHEHFNGRKLTWLHHLCLAELRLGYLKRPYVVTVEEKLSQSITIFKYIDDKDVFQKFYSRMLAKRLIHQLTQSMDAEEAMINRLKQACGYEFTSKLHRMFTDMSVSSDLNNKFNIFLKKDNVELGINFGIYVLQAGAWPLGQAVVTPFALPQQLEKSVQKFEAFYHEHFNGRKLTWLHHLCLAELRLGYLKRPYVVTVQTFQMAILLLFETVDSLTCNEIRETLQLNVDQFQRHAVSLVDSKILLAESEELTPETILRLNMDYSNKRTRFRITAAIQKESPQEVEHTMNSVEEDRKLYLQAAIVRIMKSRKVLKHNALIQEVCAQSKVSFAPSIPMIKKCIEALIDKQYLERTPHSSEEYSYVA